MLRETNFPIKKKKIVFVKWTISAREEISSKVTLAQTKSPFSSHIR